MKLLSVLLGLGGTLISFWLGTETVLAQSTFLSITIGANLDICGVPAGSSSIYSSPSQIPTTVRDLGIIRICTNKGNGFTLRVASTNGGELRTTPTSSYKLEYQVNAYKPSTANAVDGGSYPNAFKPPSASLNIPQPLFISPVLTGQDKCRQVNGCDIGIQWQITGSTSIPAGSYTDTLIYTVTAN